MTGGATGSGCDMFFKQRATKQATPSYFFANAAGGSMDIADIMFHIPAELSARDRADIERDIQGCDGVVSVHFSRVDTHMLEVAYNPRAIDSETLRRHVSERDLYISKFGL